MSTGVRLEEEDEDEEEVNVVSCFTLELEVASTLTTVSSPPASPSSPQGLKIPPCCPSAFLPPLAMLGDIIQQASNAGLPIPLKSHLFPMLTYTHSELKPRKATALKLRAHLPPPILPAAPPLGVRRARERPTVVRGTFSGTSTLCLCLSITALCARTTIALAARPCPAPLCISLCTL